MIVNALTEQKTTLATIENRLYDIQAILLLTAVQYNEHLDELFNRLSPAQCVESLKSVYDAVKTLYDKGQAIDLAALLDVDINAVEQLRTIQNSYTITPVNFRLYLDANDNALNDLALYNQAHTIIDSIMSQQSNRFEQFNQLIEQSSVSTLDSQPIGDHVTQFLDELDRRANSDGITGYSTGYPDLDRITAGLHGGELVVIAGRPSTGKTMLGLNLVQHMATQQQHVLFYSLEMTFSQLQERLLSAMANVDAQALKTGKLNQGQYQRITETLPKLQKLSLHIAQSNKPTLGQIRRSASQLKRKHGLSALVVDYLQLMKSEKNYQNRNLEIADMTRELKIIAQDLDIPVILISQLNRGVEHRNNPRPNTADLRDSGAIEQDADVIAMLYRDELVKKTDNNQGYAELLVRKNRSGPVGRLVLEFCPTIYQFKTPSAPFNYTAHDDEPNSTPDFLNF